MGKFAVIIGQKDCGCIMAATLPSPQKASFQQRRASQDYVDAMMSANLSTSVRRMEDTRKWCGCAADCGGQCRPDEIPEGLVTGCNCGKIPVVIKPLNEIFLADLRRPVYAIGYLEQCLEDDGKEGYLYALKKVVAANDA